MRIYRITKGKYAQDLSGEGARLYGGRWNRRGTSMLYTASNSSLAMLEKLVHIPPYIFPKDLKITVLEFPDTIPINRIVLDSLPEDWISRSEHPKVLDLGDQFVAESEFLCLRIPSAINPIDENILVNPKHPDFSKLKIVDELPLSFDKRLLKEA